MTHAELIDYLDDELTGIDGEDTVGLVVAIGRPDRVRSTAQTACSCPDWR